MSQQKNIGHQTQTVKQAINDRRIQSQHSSWNTKKRENHNRTHKELELQTSRAGNKRIMKSDKEREVWRLIYTAHCYCLSSAK